MFFINSIIENPTFSSQTKDKHTTRVSEFGSKFTLTDDFNKKILKLGFVESLLAVAEAKEKKSLTKTDGKKIVRLSIPKLDDANKAGTNESEKCTLILTEGDSAKTTAGFWIICCWKRLLRGISTSREIIKYP